MNIYNELSFALQYNLFYQAFIATIVQKTRNHAKQDERLSADLYG